MAFLELIFSLPKNDRNVSFAAISKVTGLTLEQVERLVMRAMSLELIKGTIDEVKLFKKSKLEYISWKKLLELAGSSLECWIMLESTL